MAEAGFNGEAQQNKQPLPIQADQKGESWYNRPHAELVGAFKGYIQEQERLFGGTFSPEKLIKMRLNMEATSPNKAKADMFRPLELAWNILSYDRFEPGSPDEREAGRQTNWFFGNDEEKKTIALTDPLQVKILDALTDALGIQREKGQAEIPVPHNLQLYDEWIHSDEYQQRVAQAHAKKAA